MKSSLIAAAGAAAVIFFQTPLQGGQNPAEETLKGLHCEILDDAQGIPHIKADGEDAVFGCYGYVHARDRAWQMDYFRRTAQGRTAELLGTESIRADFLMRLLGIYDRAKKLFEGLNAEQKSRLWAYAHGVDLGMAEAIKRGSYEFRKFGYFPDPWKPQDSVAILLLESFDQTRDPFETQMSEADELKNFGPNAASLFDRNGIPWNTAVLKPGEYPPSAADSANGSPKLSIQNELTAARKSLIQDLPELMPYLGDGSNNWVIAPSRSENGNTWLANDPHLALVHPPFWHWVHLKSPALDVIGAAVPGLPLIASGTNRNVSWGLTNSFLEASRVIFVPNSELNTASTHTPLIWFRFFGIQLPFFFQSFHRTAQNFPVLPLPSPKGQSMVLLWSGFDLNSQEVGAFLGMMSVDSARKMDSALSQIGVPSWNFVFADGKGEIGYRAIGRVGRNTQSRAYGIPTESLENHSAGLAFPEILNAEEMPHVFQPAHGYVVTANNRQWPSDSKFDPGRGQATSFRAYRIENLINPDPSVKHTLESIQKIQCDQFVTDASFLVPKLMPFLDTGSGFRPELRETPAIEALTHWDYESGVDCKACAVYRRWMDRLLADAHLDENALYRILSTQDFNWVPNLVEIIQKDFRAALDDLKIGANGDLPNWGSLHLAYFDHIAGAQYFKARPISTGGDDNTVNPGGGSFVAGIFRHQHGASQRLIVELSADQPPAVYHVLAGTNLDQKNRKLGDPDGEWERWANCGLQRRLFPLENWSGAVELKF